MERRLITSESVFMGHPDKVADRISDSVLDAILDQDATSRVACESFVTGKKVVVGGEITTKATVDYEKVAREAIKEIGYQGKGFSWDKTPVEICINRQSPDISQGVTEGEGMHKEQGAGDQGMMFGFACNETPELMPFPIYYAHRLSEKMADLRLSGEVPWLLPDGKCQITCEYADWKPGRIHTVVVSTQHTPDVDEKTIRDTIIEKAINAVLPAAMIDGETVFHINPTGRFVIGGPEGDVGLTGRKIIVDTYGGRGRHGGGAFSGKDPTKVDRSAAYAARWVAKNLVAAGIAERVEVELAYAIGVAKPLAIAVDTSGTGVIPESKIVDLVRDHFDLTPKGIISTLDLCRPIYKATSSHGHFGRSERNFTWERTVKAQILAKAAGINNHAGVR